MTTTKATTVSQAKPKAAAKAKPTKQEQATAAVARMRQAALNVVQPSPVAEIVQIPVNFVSAVAQVRTEFDDSTIAELAADIAERGIIQPILVRKGEHGYLIVAGERRYRAAKLAGLEMIPAIVTALDNDAAAAVQIAENIQREDLSLADTAKAVRKLYELNGNSVTDTATKLHKSKSWVSKHLAASCPDLGYTARKLLEDGTTEDLEIILTVDKIARMDWRNAREVAEQIRAGKASRKTVLDLYAVLKEQREQADAEKAAAAKAEREKQPKPTKAEQKLMEAERERQLQEERAAREREPRNILRRIEADDFQIHEMRNEHRDIIDAYLVKIWEFGQGLTSSKAFRSALARMIDSNDYNVIEIDTLVAGYLGDGLNLNTMLRNLAEALERV